MCHGQKLPSARETDGIDYEEFFSSVAETWEETIMPGGAASANMTDTHPLTNLRVNVNPQMFDAIYDKLGVKEGDGMYLTPTERANIWGEKS